MFDDDQEPSKPDNNRFLHQRRVIVIDEKSQVQVPDKPDANKLDFKSHCRQLIFSNHELPQGEQIEEYLTFAQSLLLSQQEDDDMSNDNLKKKSKGAFSGDGLILNGMTQTPDQVNEKALNFLKIMDNNITKAKFYLLQPTLLIYNQYRHQNQLTLSEEYMNEKIEQYISKLNEDKISQQVKWKQEVMELINNKNKVHINQILQIIEQASQMKYELPENIKNIYQQSIQIQNQLNKILKNQEKVSLSQLKQTLEKYEEMPVITSEIDSLKELILKSEQFLAKLNKLPIQYDEKRKDYDKMFNKYTNYKGDDKIQLRTLNSLVTEYKLLPVEFKLFENVHKRLVDMAQEIVEKISKFIKIQQNRTRLAQQNKSEDKNEKISLQSAAIIKEQISNLIVACDDFDTFIEIFDIATELNDRATLQIDQVDQQQQLLKDGIIQIILVLDSPFQLDIQDKLQFMIDYKLKNGESINLEQVERLKEFTQPYMKGEKDLQVMQQLMNSTERWNQQATEAFAAQNLITIEQLLSEAKNMPVDDKLQNNLQILFEKNGKLQNVHQILKYEEPAYKAIIDLLKTDETWIQIRECLFELYNRRSKEEPLDLALKFFEQWQKTIDFYLLQIQSIDDNIPIKIISLQELKEIQKEINEVKLDEFIEEYGIWLSNLTYVIDNRRRKKSQSEDGFYADLIYHFKVPELLQLILTGIQKNYLCQELIDSIAILKDVQRESILALTCKDISELKQYNSVFMPQFYWMGKRFRQINKWSARATNIINSTPRIKNLIMKQKLIPFIAFLETIDSSADAPKKEKKTFKLNKKTEDHSVQEESQSQNQNKSKRVKLVSKLMQDDSMAFYDANASMKKAFGDQQEAEQAVSVSKKNLKRIKRPQPKEEPAQNIIEIVKAQSQELLNLYTQDKTYCICRQGGESAINDFKIIKSLEEKNVEQFFHYHLRLSQQTKYMICCDNCEEWFHYECMGIRSKTDKYDKYTCRVCLQRASLPFLIGDENLWEAISDQELFEEYKKVKQFSEKSLQSAGEYIYSQQDMPTLQDFKEFMVKGRTLPLQDLLEYELMTILEQKICDWEEAVNDNSKTFHELLVLYMESTWIPFKLPQASGLLTKLCQMEFIQIATEQLAGKNKKNVKKPQIDRTDQLLNLITGMNLNELEQKVKQLIYGLKLQSEFNSNLNNQILQLKKQPIEKYELLLIEAEEYVKQQTEQLQLKIHFNKLTDLKSSVFKLKNLDLEVNNMFHYRESPGVYLENLSEEVYDRKPTLSDVQQKIKEYDSQQIKIQLGAYDFLLLLQSKANEFVDQIQNQLINLAKEEQFELCQQAYKLKCKLPQFKDLLINVHKDVQLKMIQWLPFIKI